MSCEVVIDHRVKSDILDCDLEARREIRDFLIELQEVPWPTGRCTEMSLNAFYYKLPCGYFISWEVLGDTADLMRLALLQDTVGITVRILGVGCQQPR